MGVVLLLLGACAWVTDAELEALEEGCAEACPPWYDDADGDGHGDPTTATTACDPPPGAVSVGDDCDDGDPGVHPGAPETCDGRDEDCDGVADDEATGAPTWYDDADDDGHGDPATGRPACEAPSGTVATGEDCDDADPEVHPDRSEVCGNHRDDDCEAAATCRPAGARFDAEADAAWTWTAGTAFGAALAGGVDLTGDSDPDVAVGAPDAGAVVVLAGPDLADAGPHAPAALLQGTAGWGVAILLADVTGEGRGDLVVTASDGSGVALVAGPLPATGDPVDLAFQVLADGDPAHDLGAALAWGDLAGGRVADLVLAAPGDDGGTVHVLAGPLDGTTTLAEGAALLLGGAVGDRAGTFLAVGDLDGDGQDDLLVGAPGQGAGAGGVDLVLGPLSGTLYLSAADASWSGPAPGAALGPVAVAGDVDGDGLPDLLLAAPDGAGTAWLLVGEGTLAGDLGRAAATFTGAGAGAAGGTTVAGPGDVDADGFADLALGSPGAGGGEVAVFYGPLTGAHGLGNADLRLVSPTVGAALGSALDAPGDQDRDGYADILAGAPGAAGACLVLGLGE